MVTDEMFLSGNVLGIWFSTVWKIVKHLLGMQDEKKLIVHRSEILQTNQEQSDCSPANDNIF